MPRSSLRRPGFAALALLAVVTGCGTNDGATGDCSARIEFRGVTYRSHNELNDSAPTESAELGDGRVLGCDREAVDRVAVHRIRGVDDKVAIAIKDRDWLGVYVAEGLSPSEWPPRLRS